MLTAPRINGELLLSSEHLGQPSITSSKEDNIEAEESAISFLFMTPGTFQAMK